ncbi:MAG: sulfatase-like hydrolase/transferase [Desulfobacterales bacterium]
MRVSSTKMFIFFVVALAVALAWTAAPAIAADKKPNIVMMMQDDTGWTDFGAYLGGAALGHPTPNVDRMAKEGMMFTNWYGQASCTAGRASFLTGRIPIRTALSVVVAPGDRNSTRRRRRPLPSSSRRTATRRTSRENGISAISRKPIRSNTDSTR